MVRTGTDLRIVRSKCARFYSCELAATSVFLRKHDQFTFRRLDAAGFLWRVHLILLRYILPRWTRFYLDPASRRSFLTFASAEGPGPIIAAVQEPRRLNGDVLTVGYGAHVTVVKK